MSEWLYTLRARCIADLGEFWQGYLAFSGFKHISELVTLDGIMCPDIVGDLVDEDWKHNVHADLRLTFFRDPQYLLNRQPLDSSRHQLIAAVENPSGSEHVPTGFVPCGFDIMDAHVGNSTLTNCGPIPEAFMPSMVNEFGLLADCELAVDVRDRMRQLQPDDPHLGNCQVWFIVRSLPRE